MVSVKIVDRSDELPLNATVVSFRVIAPLVPPAIVNNSAAV